MAYQTGSSTTSIVDLLNTLFTFATANGWTQNQAPAAVSPFHGGINRGTTYVQFADGADSTNMSMFISTGWDASAAGNQPGDSGAEMRVTQIDGPHENYWFFEQDTYIHVVVEYDAGLFRHFGFGQINKVGTWTGGDYAYGHEWSQGSNSDDIGSAFHYTAFDGTGPVNTSRSWTMRVSGADIADYASESPTRVWGFGGDTNDSRNDNNGVPSIPLRSTGRSRFHQEAFYSIPESQLNAFKPLIPIPIYTTIGATPDIYRLVGFVPDMRWINMTGIDPAEEISVGGNTWTCFPVTRKKRDQDNTEESANLGIAYRRDNT